VIMTNSLSYPRRTITTMTHSSPRTRRPAMANAPLSAATEAALWALSNGRCYAPGCTQPVVVEVCPGVYKKKAQVAHVYGVKKGSPRYRENFPDRDSFKYLLLLCTPHHGLVDDKKVGARMYPPATLLGWKRAHEGSNAPRPGSHRLDHRGGTGRLAS
jgi:hypothetical protein